MNPEAKLRHLESPRKRPSPALSADDALLSDLVKDLRSRRVFSPSVMERKLGSEFGCGVSEDDAKMAKNGGLESRFSCENGSVCEKKDVEIEGSGKVDLGFGCEAQKLGNGIGDSKMVEGLSEQFVRTTPPGVGEKFGNSLKMGSDSKTKVVRSSDLVICESFHLWFTDFKCFMSCVL